MNTLYIFGVWGEEGGQTSGEGVVRGRQSTVNSNHEIYSDVLNKINSPTLIRSKFAIHIARRLFQSNFPFCDYRTSKITINNPAVERKSFLGGCLVKT